MSIDYTTEIMPEVLKNLDLDSTDSEAEAKYQILLSANNAQRTILRKVPIEQVDNILLTVTGPLQINIPYIAWPSDYIRFSKLKVSYTAAISETNLGIKVTKAKDGSFLEFNLDESPSLQNPKWSYIDGGFELRPKPPQNQTDGYELEYVYNLPAISATQSSLLRDDLFNALIFLTTANAALKGGGKADLGKIYNDKFAVEIRGLWENEQSKVTS